VVTSELYNKKLMDYIKQISIYHIIKVQFEKVSMQYKLAFIAFLLFFIISVFLTLFITDKIINIIALIIIILSIILFVTFINESQKLFKEDFPLNKELKFNFYYHPIIKNFFTEEEKKLKKEEKIKMIDDLIVFATIEIEDKSNGFLSSPLVVLIISFVSAIIVNIITGDKDFKIETTKLITFVILILFSLFMVYISQDSLLINKIRSFKKFLNKFKYDEIYSGTF